MRRRDSVVTTSWPAGSPAALAALTPRDDSLVAERPLHPDLPATAAAAVGREFEQHDGPFHRYHRRVHVTADGIVTETVRYRIDIPWFGWLFARPVRRAVRHRRREGTGSHWWAPPDRLHDRQVRTLALLATAAMAAAFANTLFTQTANFAAKEFGVDATGQGVGGAVVRLGIVVALPFAVLADRIGRRRTLVLLAWLTPLLCALGAVAPGFWTLVASQTVARPLGLALALVATVAAVEDMPRNSRAYALSVLALAGGLGAGVAVVALRLADVGDGGWRYVYALSLVWLPIAVVLVRQLSETRRFETVHRIDPPMDRRRLALVAGVALLSNLFVAPASFFQNRYLEDVRGYSGGGIALFTLVTGTPASFGLVLGGRLADTIGRRRLIAWCTPASTVCLVASFATAGAVMWTTTFVGALLAAMVYPAYQVYRSELFPTGRRGWANGLVTTTALVSGSAAIVVVGWLHDHGWSFGWLVSLVAVGQLLAALVAHRWYPETAHLELEQLNPEDPAVTV